MISIVICARSMAGIPAIEANIAGTIGVDYELVVIDNSRSRYSIFEAYNEGVRRSQGEILCFMHDDIVYHAEGWGRTVLRHFQDGKVGMIGVGGARYLSDIPSVWWAGWTRHVGSLKGTICHNCIDTNRVNLSNSKFNCVNPENNLATRVVVLDGLWFCVRKELFSHISFDEECYGGFHFYDLDLSMQVGQLGYELRCIFDVRIEHISASECNADWLGGCNKFYAKWRTRLPVSSIELPFMQRVSVDYEALRMLRRICESNKVSMWSLCGSIVAILPKVALLAVVYCCVRLTRVFHREPARSKHSKQ